MKTFQQFNEEITPAEQGQMAVKLDSWRSELKQRIKNVDLEKMIDLADSVALHMLADLIDEVKA